eukprot:2574317-Amphidinium_carterae.1
MPLLTEAAAGVLGLCLMNHLVTANACVPRSCSASGCSPQTEDYGQSFPQVCDTADYILEVVSGVWHALLDMQIGPDIYDDTPKEKLL